MKKESGEKTADKGNGKSRRLIIFGMIVTLLLGAASLIIAWNNNLRQAVKRAIKLAESAEAFLPAEQVSKLEASPNDIEKPEYQQIKNGLIRFKKRNEDIVFAYLYTQKDGKIYFLADSERPDSEDYSPPGQEYNEATSTDKQPFVDGKSIMTKPLTDRWGTWVSSLVPVKDPQTGNVIAVFGVDYNAQQWHAEAFWHALQTAVTAICILSILIAFYWMAEKLNELAAVHRKLKDREELFRTIFSQAPIGISIASIYKSIDNNIMFEKILAVRKKN
jgi:hypothetical protein